MPDLHSANSIAIIKIIPQRLFISSDKEYLRLSYFFNPFRFIFFSSISFLASSIAIYFTSLVFNSDIGNNIIIPPYLERTDRDKYRFRNICIYVLPFPASSCIFDATRLPLNIFIVLYLLYNINAHFIDEKAESLNSPLLYIILQSQFIISIITFMHSLQFLFLSTL